MLCRWLFICGCIFLSTPSARRATIHPERHQGRKEISIHALREEGDASSSSSSMTMTNFYPRPPRGGRPCTWSFASRQQIFLSTPSARRATWKPWLSTRPEEFLSTPSARRATRAPGLSRPGSRYFYPRPPRGGRRTTDSASGLRDGISIHALREEGDPMDVCPVLCNGDFYPRPPRGGRHSFFQCFV